MPTKLSLGGREQKLGLVCFVPLHKARRMSGLRLKMKSDAATEDYGGLEIGDEGLTVIGGSGSSLSDEVQCLLQSLASNSGHSIS